jgi:4-hydroxythreonine-4-phosphate dehydrogenase
MTAAALAVSMGDPAGVGLEIAAKAWAARGALELPPFVIFGDAGAAMRAARRAGVNAPVETVSHVSAGAAAFANALPVVQASPLDAPETPGRADPALAPAILGAIEAAVAAVRRGEARALTTLPIAKDPLNAAGFPHPGHTEYVAALTRDMPQRSYPGPVMMLAGPTLKVALATIHTPLKDVAAALDGERVRLVAHVLHDSLKVDFAIARPRIAMAGLNPHAGEAGRMGQEEAAVLNPAAAALRAEGINICDARPADTLFHAEAREGYDAVLAMYHDQGLIPLKTLHFWDAVNITIGLPIVRTSPDHGVAYDLAGTGRARADSFIAALRAADAIAEARGRAA